MEMTCYLWCQHPSCSQGGQGGPQSGSVGGAGRMLALHAADMRGDAVRLKNAVESTLSCLILSGQHKTCNDEEQQCAHD